MFYNSPCLKDMEDDTTAAQIFTKKSYYSGRYCVCVYTYSAVYLRNPFRYKRRTTVCHNIKLVFILHYTHNEMSELGVSSRSIVVCIIATSYSSHIIGILYDNFYTRKESVMSFRKHGHER